MKRITINEELCIGCGLCEVHCTVEHSKSKDPIKAYKREYPKPVSQVRVETAKPTSLSIRCQHCEEAPCIFACLSGAMSKNEDSGLVVHDAEKCTGCWTCIMVCPYAALRIDPSQKIVTKCDVCPDLEIPACVANCPNEALTYQEALT